MRHVSAVYVLPLLIFLMAAIGFVPFVPADRVGAQARPSASLPVYGYTVVKTYPHDRDAFTEGLIYQDGVLYESTGLEGRSWIRKTQLETGKVLQQRDLAQPYFGEGIVIWKSLIYQLTYKHGVAFVYDKATLAPRNKTFKYHGEGWALTHDGTNIIMTDGTSELRILDPDTFAERRQLRVTADGEPVPNLNEMEIVKGELFANIWTTDRIARINLRTGNVTGWIDLSGLLSPREREGTDVLNGIAYDAAGDRLFVTGKLWPKIFEIKVVRKP